MKEIYKKGNDWTYFVERGFAWFPMYCQGTFVWLRHYWVTWPEKPDGSLVMASDVLSAKDMAAMNNQDSEMYRVYFPYDPRKALGGKS